jgi:hypothetical protein
MNIAAAPLTILTAKPGDGGGADATAGLLLGAAGGGGFSSVFPGTIDVAPGVFSNPRRVEATSPFIVLVSTRG